MRRALVVGLIILSTHTAVAIANVDSSGPIGGKPYDQQLNAVNEKFFLELKRRIERAGFGEVEVLPSMFVVTAKNANGHAVALIVDSVTLEALQIGSENDPPAAECEGTPEALRRLR